MAATLRLASKKRICIVTPDAVPAVANGGIGTHVFYLSRILAAQHDVTILYATPPGYPSTPHPAWRRFYSQWNITFEMLDAESRRHAGGNIYASVSMAVFSWLALRRFDIVHFQDWRANGFHAIQSKRVTGRFAGTVFCLTMHSNTEWIHEGMRRWNPDPKTITKLAWMEQYCHAHCDVLISPSQHMFDWAEARGWSLCPNRRLLPYCFLGESRGEVTIDRSHIAFLGRLETRKGLELFCDAVAAVLRNGKKGVPEKITFLGKHGLTGKGSSAAYLRRFAKACKGRIRIEIEHGLDTFQVMEKLKTSGAVAVLPSLADNFPFTVLECIENAVPFIAASTGGIPEAADSAVLFEPTVASLAAKLEALPLLDFTAVKHRYDSTAANAGWPALNSAVSAASEKPARDAFPLVSICVAYYNHGKYLGQLLESIEANAYSNYEVVVVNDGSSDPFSDEVFADLERRCAGRGNRRFVRQENGGVSAARNAAAAMAEGEYLLFMDADNCAKPDMLTKFAASIQHSGADCLTCHFDLFRGDDAPGPETPVFSRFAPYGACLEAGLLENVFGDANFIVKKTVFEELGGFTVIRDASFEDYEFLAKLVLEGHQLDVIPEPLFWYRHLEAGFSRTTDRYANMKRIVDVYASHAPPYLRGMYMNLLLPMLTDSGAGGVLRQLAVAALPAGTFRGEAARRVYRSLRELRFALS
jgi:glycosyltransferase involved in cell wall biosynthesis